MAESSLINPVLDLYHTSILKRKKIVSHILTLVSTLNLKEYDDDNERVKIFITALLSQNRRPLSFSTVVKNVNLIKPYFFPDSKMTNNGFRTIYENSIPFYKQNLGLQERYPGDEQMELLFKWIENGHKNYKTLHILLIKSTGLRVNEFKKLTVSHLIKLAAAAEAKSYKKNVFELDIKRKDGSNWTVVYFPQIFIEVLDFFDANTTKVKAYKTFDIDSPLYDETSATLSKWCVKAFISANKTQPPQGFGLHSIRTWCGNKYPSRIASTFLGHKREAMTKKFYTTPDPLKQSALFEETNLNEPIFQILETITNG